MVRQFITGSAHGPLTDAAPAPVVRKSRGLAREKA